MSYPRTYGSLLPSSSLSFYSPNPGEFVLAYDFSGTPVSIDSNTDFFAFQMKPIGSDIIDNNSITQNVTSPHQYCRTTQSATFDSLNIQGNNDCGVPEIDATSGTSAITLIGVVMALLSEQRRRSALKRKL